MIVEKEELLIKKLNTLLNTKIKTLGIENDIDSEKEERKCECLHKTKI